MKHIGNEEWEDLMFEGMKRGCLNAIFFFLILIFFALLFGSCTTTRTVTLIETKTDTVVINKTKYDSIHVQDSTYLHEAMHGDTLFVEKVKYIREVKWQLVRDSFYIAKTDSVPVPYPVEVKVPRELNWWQKTLQRTGGIALILLLLWLGWKAWKIYTKSF